MRILDFIMRDFIKAIRAISDETRLRIINLILERECCVCEVIEALNISQTRASRNLGILYNAGFLTLRKDGLWSYYSLNLENIKGYLSELIEAMKKALRKSDIPQLTAATYRGTPARYPLHPDNTISRKNKIKKNSGLHNSQLGRLVRPRTRPTVPMPA